MKGFMLVVRRLNVTQTCSKLHTLLAMVDARIYEYNQIMVLQKHNNYYVIPSGIFRSTISSS